MIILALYFGVLEALPLMVLLYYHSRKPPPMLRVKGRAVNQQDGALRLRLRHQLLLLLLLPLLLRVISLACVRMQARKGP